MRPDEADSCVKLTQQEIDFLLDLLPFDSSPCRGAFGPEARNATAYDSRFFPKLHRQGRYGLGLSVAEASKLWRSLLDGLFLREMGLGPNQWVIVWLVAVQGGEMTLDGVGDALELEAGELDAELAVLQGRGILKLLDSGRSGGLATGSVCIRDLTAMQRLIALAKQVRDAVLHGIGDEELSAMHATLLKVIANLHAAAGATNPPPAPR